jgi:hypothetical protein
VRGGARRGREKGSVPVILNFAPVTLKLPSGVVARNVDFVQEFAVLSFHISRDDGEGELAVASDSTSHQA